MWLRVEEEAPVELEASQAVSAGSSSQEATAATAAMVVAPLAEAFASTTAASTSCWAALRVTQHFPARQVLVDWAEQARRRGNQELREWTAAALAAASTLPGVP